MMDHNIGFFFAYLHVLVPELLRYMKLSISANGVCLVFFCFCFLFC